MLSVYCFPLHQKAPTSIHALRVVALLSAVSRTLFELAVKVVAATTFAAYTLHLLPIHVKRSAARYQFLEPWALQMDAENSNSYTY